MAKKKVSFIANGRRVIFYAKSASKRRPPKRMRLSRAISRRNYRIRRDTEKLVEAGLPLIHPALPLVKAGAQLIKDILDT
jgi:hypothetical protein